MSVLGLSYSNEDNIGGIIKNNVYSNENFHAFEGTALKLEENMFSNSSAMGMTLNSPNRKCKYI